MDYIIVISHPTCSRIQNDTEVRFAIDSNAGESLDKNLLVHRAVLVDEQ